IPQFSLHAWFFAIATAIGTLAGAKVSLLPIFRIPVHLQKVSAAHPLNQHASRAQYHFRVGLLLFITFVIWAISRALDEPKLGYAALFGLAFGLIIERAQICFTSAFRDLWITGCTQMAKAIIAGMA